MTVGGEGWLVRVPSVEEATGKLLGFPLLRRDASAELTDEQRSQFLQQAVIQKGMDRNTAEVVGVFKRVPIEIISKTRFNEKRRILLFTLPSRVKVGQTRVYDVAMIRDASTAGLHLVSDMTRVSIARLR